MLKIPFDLTDFEEVEIIPIADVHVGNPLCDIGALKDIVEYIDEEPANPKCARICLLNGDLTESITRKSVGDLFEQTMSPQLQVATITEMFKKLAEPRERYPMGKILSYCGGNHDVDRYKDTGITSAESIAVNLGLEDRYSAEGCYCFIKLNRMHLDKVKKTITYTLYNQHLTGSAGTAGGKVNRIERVSSAVVADLIVGSHFHVPATFKEDIVLPHEQTCAVTQKTITYLITNAFLRYGGFAQKMGMKPATITIPKVFVRQRRESRKQGQQVYFTTEVLL